MQNDYPMIAKIEVELTQEKEMDQLPNRPSKKLFPVEKWECFFNLIFGAILHFKPGLVLCFTALGKMDCYGPTKVYIWLGL